MTHCNVWIIRHGERIDETHLADEWRSNCDGRFYDPPLTNQGLQQATIAATTLKELFCSEGIELSRIYSSPLIRAVQTAQQIADTFDLPVTLISGLAECAAAVRRCPSLPMLTIPELNSQFGITRIEESQEYPNTFFGAVDMLGNRGEENILIVCHREGIRDLAYSNNINIKRIPYCSIAKFQPLLSTQEGLSLNKSWVFHKFFSNEGELLRASKSNLFKITDKNKKIDISNEVKRASPKHSREINECPPQQQVKKICLHALQTSNPKQKRIEEYQDFTLFNDIHHIDSNNNTDNHLDEDNVKNDQINFNTISINCIESQLQDTFNFVQS